MTRTVNSARRKALSGSPGEWEQSGGTGLRTLPLRVGPLPGEAIDSWLEAIARRHGVALGDIVLGLGLTDDQHPGWLVCLREQQAATAALGTGIWEGAITAMTLNHYSDTVLDIDPRHRRVKRSSLFGNRNRSRYCPQCLSETGGRWQLSWRLPWFFACTQHRCLLADQCPECGREQRRHAHVYSRIPLASRCDLPVGVGNCCNADLTAAATFHLPERHPILAAQGLIAEVIVDDHADFGLYARRPCSARRALTDLKSLMVRILARAARYGPEGLQPTDLLTAFTSDEFSPKVRWRNRRNGSHYAPSAARDMALGVTAAVHVLQSSTITEAADRARWLITRTGRMGDPAELQACDRESRTVSAILIKSHSPSLGAHLQLRYRCVLPVPAAPAREPPAQLIRRMPSALWPAWTARLTPPGELRCNASTALACAVLLIGSELSAQAAAQALGGSVTGTVVQNALRAHEGCPQWEAICIALIRLHDHLVRNATPIDYQRRRRLDYSRLLSERRWKHLCTSSDAPSATEANLESARAQLIAKISGNPINLGTVRSPRQGIVRTPDSKFLIGMTPELATLLDAEGLRFLRTCGVEEPLTWHPPLALLDGLDLPEPDDVDLDYLHHLVRATAASLSHIANALNISVHAVRYLLEQHPPITETPLRTARVQSKMEKLRHTLDADALRELYVDQHCTQRSIGTRYGVAPATIRLLLATHGIQRPSSPQPQWLFDQYIIHRHTRAQIAARVGAHPDTIGYLVRHFELLQRPYAVPDMRQSMSPEHSRELVARPSARRTGWADLQRFNRSLPHPTMTAAAREQGISLTSLSNAIRRLELDYGSPLLLRARLPLLMRPTPLGARIASAVFTLTEAHSGEPETGAPQQRSGQELSGDSLSETPNKSARPTNLS